ncbi:MAG: energy transducer TonB [Paludibacteraceae bacterium]|nr:energy transducer TonB [Paludibacteraceae bacterium]
MKKLFIFISMCLAVNVFARSKKTDANSGASNVRVEATEEHTVQALDHAPVEATAETESDDEIIFYKIEKKAQFPGGNQPMYQFLRDNLVYPEQALKDSIQGKVFVEFVVNRDGSICNATVIRSSQNELLDAEAVRVVNIMPKWVPGEQLGKPVRSKFTLPVFFKL